MAVLLLSFINNFFFVSRSHRRHGLFYRFFLFPRKNSFVHTFYSRLLTRQPPTRASHLIVIQPRLSAIYAANNPHSFFFFFKLSFCGRRSRKKKFSTFASSSLFSRSALFFYLNDTAPQPSGISSKSLPFLSISRFLTRRSGVVREDEGGKRTDRDTHRAHHKKWCFKTTEKFLSTLGCRQRFHFNYFIFQFRLESFFFFFFETADRIRVYSHDDQQSEGRRPLPANNKKNS